MRKSLADLSSLENSLDCAVVGINLKSTFRISKCRYLLGFINIKNLNRAICLERKLSSLNFSRLVIL